MTLSPVMVGKKKYNLKMISLKFRLLTLTQNQMLRLAMLKAILRMKKEKIKRNKNRSSSCRTQHKSNQRPQKVADYKPGVRLKEGTQKFIPLSI